MGSLEALSVQAGMQVFSAVRCTGLKDARLRPGGSHTFLPQSVSPSSLTFAQWSLCFFGYYCVPSLPIPPLELLYFHCGQCVDLSIHSAPDLHWVWKLYPR